MKKEDIRLAVITSAPFPKGNVSTIRYTSYLLSLVKKNIYSYVLIYCPTRMAKVNKETSGIFNGIEFQYSTRITWNRYNIFTKVYYLLLGLFNSISYLKKKKINVIILYGDNRLIVHLFYYFVCRIMHIKYLGDRSEYPSLKVRNSYFLSSLYIIKMRLFDGILVMTKELFKYYSSLSCKKNFCFLLPMTIDSQRFDNLKKRKRESYIATVFGVHNRDGLLETLISYSIYLEKGGTYDLVLIGDFYSMPNLFELNKFLDEHQFIRSKIKILGKVDINKVPLILYNASCLITTPNSYISGGFPTKLGEYMLSGTPIVATNPGELSNYLNDKEDVLFSAPQDFENISYNLLLIERDKDISEYIAHNAYFKVKKIFSADTYIQSMLEFINE